ncbi:MAG: propanoyl-CoA acyltransferase [Candidatus Solincola sediminis]|uniref:Propanoyl-CoA acyltransferase n=1 Tax=Candidatus Solincola sediminis TaxID=1797199 RepID=A0A1F2WMC9_9ACTN|nr:MAG: propanoyl-CoA acyltransferase [Candidatus Solincola sediminis]OFW61417.1 MAG: propanoyl-CoA acyltransferase [Candidatus Solincola sediminis]
MEKVAIIGVGQTKYERDKKETFAELVFEATSKALEDAGISKDDVDNIVSVSSDFWDGRTISSMAISDASNAYGKDITTVEGDGTFGVLYGMMRILSGSFGVTIVCAHHKGTESNMRGITNCAFDPLVERKLGIDAISSAALQARRYMNRYGVHEEQLALVSVKNHKNAMRNPLALLPMDISVEDVMNSRKIADPLKLLDCSPVTDGACTLVLAAEREAKRLSTSKKRVWLKGTGHCSDAFRLGDRDLSDTRALKDAAKRAYTMAGISDPRKEIAVAEVYDAFSHMELMWLEGLGFCEDGAAGEQMERGVFNSDGKLPVNPSGGRLSSHPVQVAGLAAMAECALQLRGEAEDRQLEDPQTALVHGINGMCGQSHCVWILGK